MLLAAVIQAALGAVLIVFGRWGRLRATDLPSVVHSPSERARLAGVYRRGASACVAVGVLLGAVGAVGFVLWLRDLLDVL